MSAPNPLDASSARLFAALREEPPPRGAEQRALRAARSALEERPRSARRRWPALGGALLAAGALAATIALLGRPEAPSERISAEPASSLRRPPLDLPASNAVEATPPPASAAPLSPRLSPAPSHSAPVTLTDELAALKTASSALNAGDATSALAALDRYERVLKGKQLRAEATLLRIQALSRAGQTRAASALAEQFVTRNPDSPLVDRARSYVQEK